MAESEDTIAADVAGYLQDARTRMSAELTQLLGKEEDPPMLLMVLVDGTVFVETQAELQQIQGMLHFLARQIRIAELEAELSTLKAQ